MWEMLKTHNSLTKRLYKQKWFNKCNKIKKFKDTKLGVVNFIYKKTKKKKKHKIKK